MDDILIHTDRGAREVTTEECGKLKGYPSSWGTTAKDKRWIIQESSLNFWSVLGYTFTPTLIQQESPKWEHNKMMLFIQVYHLCHPYHHGKRIIEMRNQRMKLTIFSQESWKSPQTWMSHLNGRLLI
jgi:hypothetical protein